MLLLRSTGSISHHALGACLIALPDVVALLSADTLHRFCKKEHDWGWKKFMELSKVLEGFTVANTLVIKAQVQVIRYASTAMSCEFEQVACTYMSLASFVN